MARKRKVPEPAVRYDMVAQFVSTFVPPPSSEFDGLCSQVAAGRLDAQDFEAAAARILPRGDFRELWMTRVMEVEEAIKAALASGDDIGVYLHSSRTRQIIIPMAQAIASAPSERAAERIARAFELGAKWGELSLLMRLRDSELLAEAAGAAASSQRRKAHKGRRRNMRKEPIPDRDVRWLREHLASGETCLDQGAQVIYRRDLKRRLNPPQPDRISRVLRHELARHKTPVR